MSEFTLNSINVTLWEKELMTGMHEESFVKRVCVGPRDVNAEGCVFSRVDDGVWQDYVEGSKVNWENIGATSAKLTFDKSKIFAKVLDDAQAKRINDQDLMNAVIEEYKGAFADELNSYYLNTVLASIPEGQILSGAQSVALSVTSEDVYTYIAKLIEEADKKKVPQPERYLFISPSILRLLRTSKEITKDYEIMANGFLNNIRVGGCNVIVTTNMPKDHEIMLTQQKAVGYGEQLNPNDIVYFPHLESISGSGIRARAVYGVKVLRTDSIFAIKTKIA